MLRISSSSMSDERLRVGVVCARRYSASAVERGGLHEPNVVAGVVDAGMRTVRPGENDVSDPVVLQKTDPGRTTSLIQWSYALADPGRTTSLIPWSSWLKKRGRGIPRRPVECDDSTRSPVSVPLKVVVLKVVDCHSWGRTKSLIPSSSPRDVVVVVVVVRCSCSVALIVVRRRCWAQFPFEYLKPRSR
jgi:hypothetical protein